MSRLLEKGAVCTEAYYLPAATVAAVTFATFRSGGTPSVIGIWEPVLSEISGYFVTMKWCGIVKPSATAANF